MLCTPQSHPFSYIVYFRSIILMFAAFSAMERILTFILLSSLLTLSVVCREPKPARPNSQITVMGVVYCDICSNNSFSKHSYFLPGVEVRIDCMFKALSPKTAEMITFSVKRTTNKSGYYKLEVPSVDGIECAEESAVVSTCQASLMGSSSSCNIPGHRTTTDQIAIKSKSNNICIYSLNALSYKPSKKDVKLCGN